MRISVITVIVSLFLFFSNGKKAFSQTPSSFPRDSIAFFETMEAFLVSSRKEGKDFMKQFEVVWYGGYFTERQREGVYTVSNQMLKKKLRAFPDFRNFLFTVGSFVVDENQTEESYASWESILLKLLEDKQKKNFTSFLEFCNDLFRENAMYYSASTIWSSSNNDYRFGYDSLPKISFDQLDLVCFAKRDSMKISGTKGAYYPTEKLWVGQGGTVTWKKAGLLEDEVYAELANYRIDTRKYEYTADTVTFYNSFYLNDPLIGTLEDKLLANMTPDKATYPRFDSYDKRIRIENLFPGVNFDGGFSMVGSKLLGKGTREAKAIIEFIRSDTLFLKTGSENFSIRTDRIASTNAFVRIYFGEDSISHPGLNFKYLHDQKLVTLYKEAKGLSSAPYSNTFHNLEMDFEVLNWKTNEPIITLTNLLGGTKTDAYFTSENFFKEELYRKIGEGASEHPLYAIKKLVDIHGPTLVIQEVGYAMGMDHNTAKNMTIGLAGMGFVDFDMDQDLMFVDQKLMDYTLAFAKKKDYDVISIYSDIDGAPNGKINLLNYELTINGINGIVVSDSQQVVILPSKGQISMKKDMFFEFGGQVKAGRLDFYGQDFSFEYDNFKVNLNNVDSLQIKAVGKEKDREGRPILKPVRTVIEGVNGDLLIDDPFNKSGLKDFPQYPIFNSFDQSYVFYDKKEVLKGVYKRSNFYFTLEPFTIDSLDNFNNDGLRFDGTFTSAGIFPEFNEQLTLQKDFSLGFIRNTPTDGYPMYGGKGQFYNEIRLSHQGLRGDGQLDYIVSTTLSKDFIFYPDSMRTNADQYYVDEQKEGVEYPPVTAVRTDMRWLPKQDILYATSTDTGMAFYDGRSFFEGTTTISPEAYKGDGVYHFERADLGSNQFVFKFNTFDADTADFQLKDPAAGAFALKTKNVNAHVDYKGRFAEFKSNGKTDPIEFPLNEYICFMEEFKWYMDNGSIELTSSSSKAVAADVNLEGSKFISTNVDQDSLFFYSPVATYDSRRHIIKAKDVIYINSADARVYPDSGDVTIRKKAKMDPLLNSEIIANSVTEYHKIYKANTNIFGRKDYTSSGYIDYVDVDEKVQTIYLRSISVDTTGQTIGNGTISDTITFTLSPQFTFEGGVKLYAGKQFLVFDGATKINHDCERLNRPWIKFESEINPKEIYIPVDTSMKDTSGAYLASSINLNVDSTFLYSGFMTKRENYSDINVLPAYGYLTYHKQSGEYRISSQEKINQNSLAGNYLSLDPKSCKVFGEGSVDIGARTGNLKFNSAGNIVHNQVDNSVVVDLLMTVDFFFDDGLIKKIADNINENINLDPVNFNRPTYEKGLREVVGVERADEIITQLSLNGKLRRLPDELNKNMVFSDVKFKWNEESNTFKSFGKLGITNIGKEEVNKYVNGAIMITKKRSGDIVDIYLEIDANNWYYFTYRRGLMKAVSSNADFNTQIQELKKDKRKYAHQKGEDPYIYMYGSENERRSFKREFESDF